jgi:biopolymer transport protein ExbB
VRAPAWTFLALSALAMAFPDPAAAVSPMDQLLQRVEREAGSDRRESREREARFVAEKAHRAEQLQQARMELAALEAETHALREHLQANDASIADLEASLEEHSRDLKALFQSARQSAVELEGVLRDSLVSAQWPGRAAAFARLLSDQAVPTARDLRNLWRTLLQEMIELGRNARFEAELVEPDGRHRRAPVVRIGVFTALQGGRLLRNERGTLYVLPRQPDAEQQRIAAAYSSARRGLVPAPVDPSRGSWLEVLTYRPVLSERIRQGGIVGYIILGLGALGLLLGGWRLLGLWIVSGRVRRQLRRIDRPREGNPLGRVLLAYEHLQASGPEPERLELHLHEAALREAPRLTRAQSFLKLLAAVAPLLGLLGTVIGMIVTFQAISLAGSGNIRLLADGIGQALITTVLGLVAAIPLLFLHNLLASRSRALMQILDRETAGLIARGLDDRGACHVPAGAAGADP